MDRVICRNCSGKNTLFAGAVPKNNTLFARTVPANNTANIEIANYFCFFLYCTARQHPAQNASQPLKCTLKLVPANKVLFAGTVPANNLFVNG